HCQHGQDAQSCERKSQRQRTEHPHSVEWIAQETEQQRYCNRCKPQRKRRQVKRDGDEDVGDHEQRRGNNDIKNRARPKISQRMLVSLQPGICPIEITPEPLKIGDEMLDFEKQWAHDPQIARTMLASDGFILDCFCTEWTFHRYRNVLPVLVVSIS